MKCFKTYPVMMNPISLTISYFEFVLFDFKNRSSFCDSFLCEKKLKKINKIYVYL
jgi:hypothetical protein